MSVKAWLKKNKVRNNKKVRWVGVGRVNRDNKKEEDMRRKGYTQTLT